MRKFFLFLFLGCLSQLTAQSLSSFGSTNFGTTNENTTSSVTITLQNQGNKTAYVNGYETFWRFGGRVCWLNDSVFQIPAGGQYNLTVYFKPYQNLAYSIPLVLHTDSHFGSIVVDFSGQGTFSNTYYNSTQNLEGNALKNQFATLLAQNYNSLGYNSARDEMYGDLDNVNGDVTCVYTGRTATFSTRAGANANSMNCEHTMPQSLFGSSNPMQSDIHHLFPTDASANSVRSNHPYGIVNNPTWTNGGSKYASSVFEPRDVQKGNSARGLLYFALRYGDYSGFIAGMESTLRAWHLQDEPDAFEQGRNDGIYQLQNNRNPLVDYPQFEERLGSFTSNADLTNSSSWEVYPDTVWINSGDQACISLVNTGDQTLNITGTSGSGAFNLGAVPSSIQGYNGACLTVSGTGTSAFNPIALTIQSSSHSNKTIYIASTGDNGGSGNNVGQLDSLGLESLGTTSALLTVDKPASGFSTDWDGVVVFASEYPFVNFWGNNTAEAGLYTQDFVFGSGTQVSANGTQSGYCVYKSQNATDDQVIISGLQEGTDYYFIAYLYKVQSGQDDLFGNPRAKDVRTDDDPGSGGGANCNGGLIISEYIEGSSNNKCLELTNTSDSDIDLSDYRLYLTSNANSSTVQNNLSGILPSQSSYVICHSSSWSDFQNRADITVNGNVVNHNGNDLNSLVLIATGDTVDRVGDPNNLGANHTIVDNGTIHDIKDVTLVRADSIRVGTGNWSRTRKQWHALANNTFDSLGTHSFEICIAADPLVPYAYSPFGDRYGESVSISTDWALVGSPGKPGSYAEPFDTLNNNFFQDMGAAYMFKEDNGTWQEWQRIEALDRDGNDYFGSSVVLEDSLMAVGAPNEGNSTEGKVYTYRLNSLNQWISDGDIKYPMLSTNNSFGQSLNLDNGQLLIGAPNESPAVFLYEQTPSGWSLVNMVNTFSGLDGSEFGYALTCASGLAVISAPGLNNQGSVFIYQIQNGNFILDQTLTASDAATGKRFGHSVCRRNNELFIGDPNSEKVYIFQNNGSSWSEVYSLQAATPTAGDFFGSSISFDENEDLLLIGADNSNSGEGRVYQFESDGAVYISTSSFQANDVMAGQNFGHAISSYSGITLIGAPKSILSTYSATTVDTGSAYFMSLTGTLQPDVEFISTNSSVEPAFDPAFNALLAEELTNDENEVVVYPIPSEGLINIVGKDITAYSILDLSGRTMLQGTVTPTDHLILNLNDYSGGYYILQLQRESGRVTNHRIVID